MTAPEEQNPAEEAAIETVTEDLDAKKRVMRSLCEVCPPDRVFLTNTSTLSITEIAAASGSPGRVVGIHFMYPVTRSPIVEVVRGLPDRLQELLGYNIYPPFLGYVDGRHPRRLLAGDRVG